MRKYLKPEERLREVLQAVDTMLSDCSELDHQLTDPDSEWGKLHARIDRVCAWARARARCKPHWTLEPLTAARLDGGCDYGTEGVVLLYHRARPGDSPIRVVWRKGHTGWVSRGSSGYYKAQLELHLPGETIARTILDGGRLTQARLDEAWREIEERTGLYGLRLEPGRTLLFVGSKDPMVTEVE